eukprot:6192458-Ditylum_brightwellii.AAC.1
MANADRGAYMCLVDDRVRMLITQRKDSKVLQAVSNVMQSGATTVTSHLDQEFFAVTCPNDIVLYQQYMSGVDRGPIL